MNALVLIVVLLGAEPTDRQVMVDETLDFIYLVEGSEARNDAEIKFQKMSDRELKAVYTNYKNIRQRIRNLYANKKSDKKRVERDSKREGLTEEDRANGWTTYTGPRGHTVFVAPIITEPGLCDGTSARSIDWWRVRNDPNYQHPALKYEYVKGQGYQYRVEDCPDGTCPTR